MSNVLIGIIGVMLFIGLALAGASFFGPLLGQSVSEGRANGSMQVLAATATAVRVRNADLETLTPVSTDASFLAPDYLDGDVRNPVNGDPVRLVNASGNLSGGVAVFAVTRMPSDRPEMCSFLNRSGGGSGVVSSSATVPSAPGGCFRSSSSIGAFPAGDLIGFVRIR